MIRIVFLALVILLIVYKLYKINKKVLCAKAYIFIKEIKEKTPIEEANYKANLFDFFKHKEAKAVFSDMEKALNEDYSKQMDKMIFRAENWGFINTHTKKMFRKRKNVKKLLERLLLTQESEIFDGNAIIVSKNIINKHWDKNALSIAKLEEKVSALKVLLCQHEEEAKEYYKTVAQQIAEIMKNNIQNLDKDDMEVLNTWNDIIKNGKN